jgi:hypothetical protein
VSPDEQRPPHDLAAPKKASRGSRSAVRIAAGRTEARLSCRVNWRRRYVRGRGQPSPLRQGGARNGYSPGAVFGSRVLGGGGLAHRGSPPPPRPELTPAPGDIGLHTRRALRLRTGRTRAGIWVAAVIIVGTTAIAKDIMAAPTGARQAGESHRILLTLNGRGEPRTRCSHACYAAHMLIGSRKDAGVTRAAHVVQRLQR